MILLFWRPHGGSPTPPEVTPKCLCLVEASFTVDGAVSQQGYSCWPTVLSPSYTIDGAVSLLGYADGSVDSQFYIDGSIRAQGCCE